jgi:splicing factor U2AF subunit
MFVLCVQKLANPVDAAPTTVVCLGQVVSADELKDDEKYEDIMDDMRQEACRYGISFIRFSGSSIWSP